MQASNFQMYSITKNGWGRFGRIGLLWRSLQGKRFVYFLGLCALLVEVYFVFVSPVIIKISIDSILGQKAIQLPFYLVAPFKVFFGDGFNGGGLLPVPVNSSTMTTSWAWREYFQGNLWIVAVVFLVVVLFQCAASFCATWCAQNAAEHAAKKMRDRLYSSIQDLPYESLLRAQSGDWLQRCTSDVDTARRFIAQESMELCRTTFLVSFALPSMYSLSPELTFWGTLVIPVIILYSFGFHKLVEKIFLRVDEFEGVLSGIIQENVAGIRVVRAFARQAFEQSRFDSANGKFRDQVFKLIAWLGVFWGVSSMLGILQIGIVLGAGLHLYSQGLISIGLIVLFITYEQQTLWPVRQFGRVLADTGKTKVALGRMAELLALPAEHDLEAVVSDVEKRDLSWKFGEIAFEHVDFTYPDGTKVLTDVSFTVKSGERLAIVGPTGSGKSTLVHLLIRLYEPDSGRITIGGCDIRTIPKRLLRQHVSIVLQESYIYGRTIGENIRLGDIGASESAILEASRISSLHHVVEGFTGGYNTLIGERGVTLSGGQRQRLALARALIRKSSVLILDDSLSAVDTETDSRIRHALEASWSGNQKCSLIIIAHRLTTLASADRILVLENGRISAIGTHEQLMERPGLYKRLADLQSGLD